MARMNCNELPCGTAMAGDLEVAPLCHDFVTLADSSVEMLDRAGPTSVAIDYKCVFCCGSSVGAARFSLCAAQVVSGL